ncbi:MAG: 30S ribosomal protein S9 [Patescibacteria group bacterium]
MPRIVRKKEIKKSPKEIKEVEAPRKKETYYEMVGRRKEAVANVRVHEDPNASMTVNGQSLENYFQEKEYQRVAQESLGKGASGRSFAVSVKVEGGGLHAQAEAIRQGIARALVKIDEGLRSNLKTFGFLTRDPRMRERKKFGLRRARRARQWRKR